MENRVLFDWFSCTFDTVEPSLVVEYLQLEDIPFQDISGMYGYKHRLYYEGISIHYDGSIEQGVWLEMSGKGCRLFEDFSAWDWTSFLSFLVTQSCIKNITRLDVAADIFNDIINPENLAYETLQGNFVSKFHDFQVQMGNKGVTIYHGSPKSMVRVRIYDKSAEQQTTFSWVRCEIQLRDERASEFIFSFIDTLNLTELYLGVLSHYLRYVTPTADTNKRRWPVADYWANFIGSVSEVNIISHVGTAYTYESLQNFVIHQAGGAIKTLIRILGQDEFNKLIQETNTVLNPKYKNLIRQIEQGD